MKRAEVHAARINGRDCWHVHVPSHLTRDGSVICTERDTHTAALTHALVAVGLDKPAEHREAS